MYNMYPYLHLYRPIHIVQFGNLICMKWPKMETIMGNFYKQFLLCLSRMHFQLLPEAVSPQFANGYLKKVSPFFFLQCLWIYLEYELKI